MNIDMLEKHKRLIEKMNPLDGSDWSEALETAENALDAEIASQSVTGEAVRDAIAALGAFVATESNKRKYDREILIELSKSLILLKNSVPQMRTEPCDDTYSQCEECGQAYLDNRGYDYCPNCGRLVTE